MLNGLLAALRPGAKSSPPRAATPSVGFARVLSLEQLDDRLAPAVFSWIGNGATNAWTEVANWSPDINTPLNYPVAGDTAKFPGAAGESKLNNNCTVDVDYVTKLEIGAGYTGTLNLQQSLRVSSAFKMEGGKIAGAVGNQGELVVKGTGSTFDWKGGWIDRVNVKIGGPQLGEGNG